MTTRTPEIDQLIHERDAARRAYAIVQATLDRHLRESDAEMAAMRARLDALETRLGAISLGD